MAQNRNHHFVPQFYLRRFGGDRSVAVFNLDQKRLIPNASIAGQCQRAHLYGKDASVESALASLEADAAPVIRRMLESLRPPVFPSAEDASLLNFITYQWARTPAAGETADALATKMARAALRFDKRLPDEARARINEFELRYRNSVLFSLDVARTMTPLLADLWKCLLVNQTGVEFITSDAPVVLHNTWAERETRMGTTGFASSGLQVLLPLSPRHLLLLFDRDVYAIGCKQAPHAYELKDQRDIEALNAMQLAVCHRNLYFSGDPATAASIDRLPGHWRQPPEAGVVVRRAVSEDGKSQIMHSFRRTQARLNLSVLRILRKARSVPADERARRHRDAAVAVDEHLRGPRAQRYRAPRSPGPWFGVADDEGK